MYLTLEERKLLIETVIKHTNKRVPVYAQVGAWNTKDTIELAKHAIKVGADGLGIVTPSYFRLSNRGIVEFYSSIANELPKHIPIYLYAIPQNAVNDIDFDTASEIASKNSNIIGIKYSYPDFTKLQEFMLINNETFSVLAGPDHLFTALCAVGGDGVVSGNAMCISEHYTAIWNAIKDKDFELATKYQRRTNILNKVMCEINNIAAYKVILHNEGVISAIKVRKPIYNLTNKQADKLLKDLELLNYKEVII